VYRIRLLRLLGTFAILAATTAPAALAAPLEQGRGGDQGWHDRHDGQWRGDGDQRWNDGGRGGERRHDRGDRSRWERFHHDDYGDCFRTPWGLACETDRPGVYRVRDRHPGDEPGPDCDIISIEPWGWQCFDLPYR